ARRVGPPSRREPGGPLRRHGRRPPVSRGERAARLGLLRRVHPIPLAHAGAGVTAVSLVLTHGAGSNRDAPLLVAVAEAFAARGVLVLRYDLPYRQARPTGPPRPAEAARDRQGLRDAAAEMRARGAERVFLGGHSYGGRQASMLAVEEPSVADALL